MCGAPESTEHVAMLLMRFTDSNEELQPHQYAVCASCYELQRAAFYTVGEPKWFVAQVGRDEF